MIVEKLIDSYSIFINDGKLDLVNEIKYLGIIMNRKLRFGLHFYYLIRIITIICLFSKIIWS